MTAEEVKSKISSALIELYDREGDLIANKTEEETISAHLVCYLKPHFDGWNVDLEYNRDGKETKTSSGRIRILPDIVIHHRTPEREVRHSPENNLVALEVKGYWNNDDRKIDRDKLIDIKRRYGYHYLFRVELSENAGEIIEELCM